MERIRIYNDNSEVMDKVFACSEAADEFEDLLYFLDAHYERFNGEVKIFENGNSEKVKIFVERCLQDAQNSNDLDYIRSRFFVAYGAVSFIAEETHDENLAIWWDEEMRGKFIDSTLMKEYKIF